MLKDIEMAQDCPSILVASHGMYIRMLQNIFFDEYGCQYPQNHEGPDYKKYIPNTSYSTFTLQISVANGYKIENVVCHTMCEDDHLKDLV